MAGAVNAMTGYSGYKAVNDEAVIAAAPDFILAMQRGREALSAEEVFAHPAFRMTPAAKYRALVSLDGLYMLGFGPRTALAAGELAAAFYPDLAADLGRPMLSEYRVRVSGMSVWVRLAGARKIPRPDRVRRAPGYSFGLQARSLLSRWRPQQWEPLEFRLNG